MSSTKPMHFLMLLCCSPDTSSSDAHVQTSYPETTPLKSLGPSILKENIRLRYLNTFTNSFATDRLSWNTSRVYRASGLLSLPCDLPVQSTILTGSGAWQ